MRLVVRLVAGQLVTVALLAAVGVRWPSTAAQARAGLQSFAVVVAVLTLAAVTILATSIVRSQRQPPYLEGSDHA